MESICVVPLNSGTNEFCIGRMVMAEQMNR